MPRLVRIAAPATLILVALLALLTALAFGGGADAPQLIDPGAVARYGLPIAKLIVNIGAAAAIGSLVLALFALDSTRPEFSKAMDVAAGAAALWAVAAASSAFFTFLTVLQPTIRLDNAFGDLLAGFLTDTALGQAWLATTLIAAGVTVLCFAVRNVTVVFFVALLAVVGLVPMSLEGHTGGTASHDSATTAIFLHVLFAAVWLGGLVTIVLIKPTLEKGRLAVVMGRYSTVALVSFVVVAASGYLSAQIRVEELGNLLSPYGILVLVKTASLLALGLFGAMQRRFFIGRMKRSPGSGRGYFWWVVTAELAFMGIASGVAAALARTATPVPEITAADLARPTPAELLTGSPLPPPVTFERLFTQWNFDLLWLLACAFGIFFYVAAVLRLRRRGDSWPVLRTVMWIAGMLLLFYITNGGINVYEKYLFSQHMLAHMILGMGIPVLLVPGAPITLALRTMEKRTDGSRGPREWLLMLTHTKLFAFFGNPLVAAGIFAGSLWVFYYTPVFSWATTNHIGHQWMIVHFLLAGYLFVQALIGIDPSPSRPPYPIRLLILLATMAFHAFFGLALMSGTGLLLANWYGSMGWETGITALQDQQIGGGIAWSVGEIPTVALAIVVAIMWARSDARESKRYDRKAERDGDAELEEYNEMLAGRARRNS
ncbi:cytochrome c oxidase assembly protein [Salinibacterium sp. G-O1]|uniref:cytochrome c oxidase assembly protein n=1 Tax=Salinibacterium sp. G-O1 TaxID=3046208 RepID=UPI0024BACA21|nr:cytochrome c oxidase assembly protein [Salinibacterium sp. G-O1]MDJ0333725.1 cytochrome c oxidase assembly protein [Salinibacterium sp. G-O1]